jgi:hypothetical protein
VPNWQDYAGYEFKLGYVARHTTARVCKIYQRQVFDRDLGNPRISSCQLRAYMVISVVDAASLPFIKRNVKQR